MDFTPIFILGAVIIVVAVITFVVTSVQKQQQSEKVKQQNERNELKERLLIHARNFAADLQQKRALPTVATNIILKPGESAFYSAPSVLYETRAVRHYQAGHAGVRVMKGVWIGGTRGQSTSTQELSKIDTGTLTITNQRLIFDGGQQDRTVPLDKIVSVNCGLTCMELSVEGRQKSMILDTDNPYITGAIIHVCRQAKDPSNLSDFTKINLQFE